MDLFEKFFPRDWTAWDLFWNLVGWLGQAFFFSRFYVQWYATERKQQVVVPVLFWWLSLSGTLLLLFYAIAYDKHGVFIFGFAFAWIPYIRNLVIHYRHKRAHLDCPSCGKPCPPRSHFCSFCGTRLVVPEGKTP
jgi:lipid-A-disaccharide synthase-like uncharacterized protein